MAEPPRARDDGLLPPETPLGEPFRAALQARRGRVRGPLLFITPGSLPPQATLALAQAAVEGGATTVLLREKQLDRARLTALAIALRAATLRAGASLLVHSDAVLARDCGADGVHLGWGDAEPDEARRIAPGLLVGRSAHWPLQSLDCRADLLLLSPFRPTHASHPRPLLTARQVLDVLEHRHGTPVYALGGLTAADVSALPAGLAGIAVIRAIAAAADPRAAAAALREALSSRWKCGLERLA